jgi:hypothetical protein
VDRASVCLVNGKDRVAEAPSLAHYVEAVRGTATALWLDMYQGTWYLPVGGPQHDLALARQHAANGVAGGVFYYMEGRFAEWSDINWQMRLLDFPEMIVDPHHVGHADPGQ